jgi:hypothetical protein
MTQILSKIITLANAGQAATCECESCKRLRGIVEMCERELAADNERQQAAHELYQIVEEQFLQQG